MILLIDNYDSFTYNLSQYLEMLGARVQVVRNDKVSLEQISDLNPKGIVISPGPGTPSQAGICLDLVSHFKGKIPILGVCLGHQTIGQAFGAKIIRAPRPMHGKLSLIKHDGKGLYQGIKENFEVTRYHSLIIDRKTLPSDLVISAQTDDGIIMGVRHKKFNIEGVQFHPESIMTKHRHHLIKNFLSHLKK